MLDATELALLGLAGYRATRLAVHDTILDPARTRVLAWRRRRPGSAPRTAAVTLVSCVYCMGWWLCGALLAVYLLATGRFHDAPLLVHGVEWLAVAGAAALLNRVDDTLGRTAG
ncbi:DUF1360 domain-containing protein [Streptomyces thermolilacinus]|uniref:DUF1360 domain-containing protein n=1 Tax=Streptomyces thermolilacinus SPC6 TaxID=1306406 RepID=A0A1D3DLG9_9ACTN|nr:DUF1360 domain-containing protein [Streptomyces thermolilacinus]OEJ93170.1 hypothetical protein J116_000360 [Streptomyces thermolilacinus SPC6]